MLATQAVHLLLFSEQGLSFGVYAEQVKELLKTDSRTVAYKGRDLRVIQLSRRLKLQETLEKNREFLHCQEPEKETGTVGRDGVAELEPSSRILVVRHDDEGDVGVHVECLEQLSLVPLTQIFRLPPVMETKKQFQSVWGLALIDDRPVVLVDLEHI